MSLKLRAPGVRTANPYEVFEQKDPDTGDRLWLAQVNSEPPPGLAIIAGDAIHNLPAAYLPRRSAYRSFGIDMGAMLRNSMEGIETPAGFNVADMPSASVFIRPADKKFPLRTGDKLFLIPGATDEVDNHPDRQFRFHVALGEPLLETVWEMRQAVQSVVEACATIGAASKTWGSRRSY